MANVVGLVRRAAAALTPAAPAVVVEAAAPATPPAPVPAPRLSAAEQDYLFAAASAATPFAASALQASDAPHGAYFVRVLYNGVPLQLPGAGGEFCEVSHFKRLLVPYIPRDFEAECLGGSAAHTGAKDASVLARTGDDVSFDTIAPDARDAQRAAAARPVARLA